jgi:hypothetical protein
MNSIGKEYDFLVSKRKNRKNRRKIKGRNTDAWEKLRERGVMGIDTLGDGSLVSAPIAGKALPRIGRRIFRRAANFDPNPVDADKDKVVQEGTEFERPAPVSQLQPKRQVYENKTPWGGAKNLIKEQRRQTKKFQSWATAKDWKRFHKEHFDWWTFPIDRGSAAYGYEFTPPQEELEKLKNNIPYLDSLRRAASLYLRSMAWDMGAGDWIDNPDFDRGQEPLVNINQARLFKIGRSMQIHGLSNEFISVRRMVQSLRDAGAKVGNDEYWDNPHAYKYAPLNPINSVMQQALPNPESPTSGNAISGYMGMSFNPKVFSSIDGGPQRFGLENEPEFRKKYDDMDAAVEAGYNKYMDRKKAEGGGTVKNVKDAIRYMILNSEIESFFWKDDLTREEHAAFLESGTLMPKTNSGTGKKLRVYPASIGERKKERSGVTKEWYKVAPLFERYLGWIGATKSGYPAIYDLSQALTQSSSTGKRDDVTTANLIQQMLGVVDKYINPTNYTKAFEEWIRNPRIVAKDKNGKIVGVRLAFNNDREELVKEFDRRISLIKDNLAEIFSVDRSQFDRELPPDLSARKYIDDTPQRIREQIIQQLNNAMSGDNFKLATNLKQIADIVSDRLDSLGLNEKERGFNAEALKQLLERSENLALMANIKRLKPRLFDSSVFDEIPADELAMARQLIDLHVIEQLLEDKPVTVESARQLIGDEYFTDELLSALIAERQTAPNN